MKKKKVQRPTYPALFPAVFPPHITSSMHFPFTSFLPFSRSPFSLILLARVVLSVRGCLEGGVEAGEEKGVVGQRQHAPLGHGRRCVVVGNHIQLLQELDCVDLCEYILIECQKKEKKEKKRKGKEKGKKDIKITTEKKETKITKEKKQKQEKKKESSK
jgi:hypothetical protein